MKAASELLSDCLLQVRGRDFTRPPPFHVAIIGHA